MLFSVLVRTTSGGVRWLHNPGMGPQPANEIVQ